MEDYAHILDYLPQGLPAERGFKHEPIAYALGETEFKLFELVPKPGTRSSVSARSVYIGKEAEKTGQDGSREEPRSYEELTSAAQSELPFVVHGRDEAERGALRAVLQRGAGDNHQVPHAGTAARVWARRRCGRSSRSGRRGPFKSFEDIAKRVTSFKHPEKVIAKRIEQELADPTQKYHIFVAR